MGEIVDFQPVGTEADAIVAVEVADLGFQRADEYRWSQGVGGGGVEVDGVGQGLWRRGRLGGLVEGERGGVEDFD